MEWIEVVVEGQNLATHSLYSIQTINNKALVFGGWGKIIEECKPMRKWTNYLTVQTATSNIMKFGCSNQSILKARDYGGSSHTSLARYVF